MNEQDESRMDQIKQAIRDGDVPIEDAQWLVQKVTYLDDLLTRTAQAIADGNS